MTSPLINAPLPSEPATQVAGGRATCATHCYLLLAALALPRIASAEPPSNKLAPPHVDASFGYSIQPPRDWLVHAERSANPRDTLLLQMIEPAPTGFAPDITVRLIATPRDFTIDRVLADIQHDLTKEYGDVKNPSTTSRTIAGRAAKRLATRFTLTRTAVIRLIAVLPIRAGEYFIISYTGPLDTHAAGERLFDAVLNSFKLLEDEKTDSLVQEGLFRTGQWLDRLRSVKLADKLQAPQYLRVSSDGKECGYLVVTEKPCVYQRTEGVCVVEEGWTFDAAGRSRRVYTHLFLSTDLDTEQWQTRTVTLVPPASDKEPESLEMVLYEGLRERSALLTSQSFQYDQRPRNNPEIKLPAGYASRLLVRWLPRLVDLSKPQLYAFTGYDPDRRGLVVRTIEIKGPVEHAAGGDKSPAFLVRDREGLTGPPADMIFDASGRLLRMTAGSVRMDATDEPTLRRRWDRDTNSAEAKLAKLREEYEKDVQQRFKPAKSLRPADQAGGSR